MRFRTTLPLAALALVAVPALPARAASPDPRVARIVGSVSEQRLHAILEKLASFETRHTLSETDSKTRGIGAARQWIFDELKRSSPRLQVSFDTYEVAQQGRIVHDVELRNVMAVLPGRSPRRVYVSGHYDSVARPAPTPGAAASTSGGFDWSATNGPAPGVDDDGSGTALTMELARVFGESGVEFDATLVFIAFAGEEEGLIGSRLHARKAAAEGWPIEAVLNNDIVGGIVGGDGVADTGSVRVFSEGPADSPSRELARFIARQAALYVPSHHVRLIARYDRYHRGGDHSAFNQHGFPAVRFTESKENYSRQHSVLDTLEGVSVAYLARNARVDAAAMAVLGLAPPPPAVVDEQDRTLLGRGPSGYDAELRWQPSPGAVSYRVFWRDAWATDWQHEQDVGNVDELLLPHVTIDDSVFGVAAVGADGDESPVSAYVNRERPLGEVKTK